MSTMSMPEQVKRYRQYLNREVRKIEDRTVEGMKEGAKIVMESTEETPPLNPVDTGNLRRSRFIVSSDGKIVMGKSPTFVNASGRDAQYMTSHHNRALMKYRMAAESRNQHTVIMGYTAHYAVVVHEDFDLDFKRPGAGNKFLSASLKRNRQEVIDAIKRHAKGRGNETTK